MSRTMLTISAPIPVPTPRGAHWLAAGFERLFGGRPAPVVKRVDPSVVTPAQPMSATAATANGGTNAAAGAVVGVPPGRTLVDLVGNAIGDGRQSLRQSIADALEARRDARSRLDLLAMADRYERTSPSFAKELRFAVSRGDDAGRSD